MDLAPIGDERGHLEKCIDAQLGTALTSDKDINEDTRIWPAAAGCTINCMFPDSTRRSDAEAGDNNLIQVALVSIPFS